MDENKRDDRNFQKVAWGIIIGTILLAIAIIIIIAIAGITGPVDKVE